MADDSKYEDKASLSNANDEFYIFNLVKLYFKISAIILFVWLFGYFQFSPSWLLLGLIIIIWNLKYINLRRKSLDLAKEWSRDEKKVVLATVKDLPSWVVFPDVHRAEWINKLFQQVWPFVTDFVHNLLKTKVEPIVQKKLPNALSFSFSKIDLGDIPPRFGGIKVYTDHVKRNEIILDADIVFTSDAEIAVEVKGLHAGIRDLQFRGQIRVVMKPLISKVPFIGGISIFFMSSPVIDFSLTSLAGIPYLSEILLGIINEQVASILVLPNRLAFSLVNNLKLSSLLHPLPHGVVKVHVIEAKDVKKSDFSFLGKGTSDPFVTLTVGSVTKKTEVIDNTTEPVWNETFEFVVDEVMGQFLEFDVKDHDRGRQEDFLGNSKIDIVSVMTKKVLDIWLPLENVETGSLHLSLTWLYLVTEVSTLEKALMRNDGAYTCVLVINLDSAKDLPASSRSDVEPDPYVKMTIDQDVIESDKKTNTVSPRWEQCFRVFIHNPHVQDLCLQVMDGKNESGIGECTIPLKTLLVATNMTIDRSFNLKNSSDTSSISLRLVLRIMSEKAGSLATMPPDLISKVTSNALLNDDEGSNFEEFENIELDETEVDPLMSELTDSKIIQQNEGLYKRGRVQLTIRYSEQREVLIVVVHKCMSLVPRNADESTDPYVKLCLLPDELDVRKTQSVQDTRNPIYDKTFEYKLKKVDIANRSLKVCVKNKVETAVVILGHCIVPLVDIDLTSATTHWYDLKSDETVDTLVSTV